jgi:hypothetical protein
MYVMRLEVASVHGYAIQQLGNYAGVKFDEREVIDVPLRSNQQISAARQLEQEFSEDGLSGNLRNGPNAVTIYSCKLVKIMEGPIATPVKPSERAQ